MKTRRSDSPFRNPIVIGAITLLITAIAVALAYNANNGLPFVPTYQLKAELPSGGEVLDYEVSIAVELELVEETE